MKKSIFTLVLFCTVSLFLLVPSTSGATSTPPDTDRVIVKITGVDGEETVKSITWEELQQIKDDRTMRTSSTQVNSQKVQVLEPDYIRHAGPMIHSMETVSWGAERIGAKTMQKALAPTKNNVIVAVIDTGVDYTHSLLKDRIVNGYDFVDNDADPMDVQYHGTHVAGVIADTTPANVKIMPIRALNADGNGYDSHVAEGIRFAVDHGAAVINMSFGGEEYSRFLTDAIDYALSKNVLIVVSSGNEGGDTANYYPASNEKVIVVSAVDQNDNVTQFSNTGTTIDISAPGVGIISSIPGEQKGSMSGTSAAAPFVSGVAAMLMLDNPKSSIQVIEQLLKKYVDDRGETGWDKLYGEGVVNVTSYAKISPLAQPKAVDFISLPGQKNVSLNKLWTVKFDRIFSDPNIATIKLYNGVTEIPITLSPNLKNKEIIVTPKSNYESNTAYRLEIIVQNGKKYQMQFETTGLN
ncbi:S8 family peptidase [Sporosarcina beigongshangi]|uniref:S8 family peptidase n=1 Tax=Sporosarcina beigongshangi TaxID=2782538 RepID=UPI0019395BF1|nr:S8 family serine peptidase [Sporosarcina beigongshangi]